MRIRHVSFDDTDVRQKVILFDKQEVLFEQRAFEEIFDVEIKAKLVVSDQYQITLDVSADDEEIFAVV